MDPHIIGFYTAAHITSNSLIFYHEYISGYDFLIATYDEDFTFTEDKSETNYDKRKFFRNKNVPWYDNYKINYYYKQNHGTVIELLDNSGVIVDELYDKDESYQLGDAGTYKYMLSNGDMLIVNEGDVESSVLFTTHKLKYTTYKFKYPKKNNCCSFDYETDNMCQFRYNEKHAKECFEFWLENFLERYINAPCTDIISNEQIMFTFQKLREHGYMKFKKLKKLD